MPASASSFWCLMFHLDPQREHWPDHPRFHVQLAAPADGGIPPFLAWRIPCAQEQEPHRLVEFLVHHIVEEPRHPSGEPGA
ncbi:MAG: hypothetical protein HZA54_04735 [Planctomycetes bacterium]|nr:hypothetical protein [Planctomycetota bacterium]